MNERMREKNLNPTVFVLHSYPYKPQQSAHADTQGRKKMFWYIVGFFRLHRFPAFPLGQCQRIRHGRDGTPQSEYEKNVGTGCEIER